MRLIDADVLTEIIEDTDWYHVGKCGLARGANSKNDIPLYKAEDIHKAIDKTPTVMIGDKQNVTDEVNQDEYIDRNALFKRLDDFTKWCKDGRKEGVDFVLDCILPNINNAVVVPKTDTRRKMKRFRVYISTIIYFIACASWGVISHHVGLTIGNWEYWAVLASILTAYLCGAHHH